MHEKMNSLLLRSLTVTGQLNPGDCVNLDFDHQFITVDKKYSYKKVNGYFAKFGACPPSLTAENPVIISEHCHQLVR